jgi:hypothetical protein
MLVDARSTSKSSTEERFASKESLVERYLETEYVN